MNIPCQKCGKQSECVVQTGIYTPISVYMCDRCWGIFNAKLTEGEQQWLGNLTSPIIIEEAK